MMLNKLKEFLAELIEMVLISLFIILPIRFFLIQPFFVKGQSMEPNFHESDYLIVDEISFRLRNPERGEVVVLRSPQVKGQFFLKRIAGLPGETLEIKDGEVVIYSSEHPDGAVLDENYLSAGEITEGDLKLTLGSDQYFVLGDNRRFSYDSRRWGVLSRQDLVGRVWLRLWPLPQLSVFAAPLYQPATNN